MTSAHAWHQPFDNPIAAAAPVRRAYCWRPWLCLGLLVACFVPRAFLGWRADVICEDGPFYIMAAKHLEQGELAEAFAAGNLRLNTYPIMLSLLHAPGWDWVAVGKWWSIAAAVLAVLPMFGWVRRQFNDSIAILTCLVYASHPALIERSPEVLRCPTYWLVLMFTLYLLWRAVIEVRVVMFVLAGLAMALAVHTRVEGWFVLIPWLLWSAMRYCALASDRLRLAVGALSFAAMLPAFIVAINLTFLRDYPDWEFCFSHRLAVLQELISQVFPTADSEAAVVEPSVVASTAPPPVAAPLVDPGPIMPLHDEPRAFGKAAWNYVRKLVDAFGIACGLLALLGLARYGNVLIRRDQVAVLCMSTTTFAAIAVQQWRMGDVIGRYFFPIILVTLPYIALGLHELANRLAYLARRVHPAGRNQPLAWTAGLLLLIAAVGCIDALTNSFDSRRQRRDLGDWVLRHVGPNQLIIGAETRELAFVYYSEGRYCPLRADDMDTDWFRHVMRTDPVGVVVLFKQRHAQHGLLAERFQNDAQLPYPYQVVAAESLPASCRNVTVLVPSPTAQRLALRPWEAH